MRDAEDVADELYLATVEAVYPEPQMAAIIRADRAAMIEACIRLMREVSYPDDHGERIVRVEDAEVHIRGNLLSVGDHLDALKEKPLGDAPAFHGVPFVIDTVHRPEADAKEKP